MSSESFELQPTPFLLLSQLCKPEVQLWVGTAKHMGSILPPPPVLSQGL